MDYKSTKIGFSATLDPAIQRPEHKPTIGFTAAIGNNGLGDPTHEPSIGFTAKLPEHKPEKPHPQLKLDF